MLRVSKLTDYATVLMTVLAESPDQLANAVALAERARLEPPTVSKVLKQLVHAGLVASQRGAAGGYRLARPPSSISVADIVAAMEGPIGMTECSVHVGLCDHERHCGVRGNWRRISELVESALRNVTLADMLAPPPPRPARIPIRLATT